MPSPPFLDSDLTTRRILVHAKDVVYVKGILEGHSGLAVLFAQKGGDLTLATPHSRAVELDQLLSDLKAELSMFLVLEASG